MGQEDAMCFLKATDLDMRGNAGTFQFEIGKVYTHPNTVVVCRSGFHCCTELDHIAQMSGYRPNGNSRYFIVRAWGQHDAESQVAKKHAFEHMEFVTELKYKTLEDVEQAMASIRDAFQDKPDLRDANLQQFQKMQQQFPSILKKRTKCLRNRRLVLEDVNNPRQTKPIVKSYHSCYPREMVWYVGTYHDQLMHSWGTHVLVDVFHHDHEPQIGLSPKVADAYCVGLMAKNKLA
jgi:hypothetical protein